MATHTEERNRLLEFIDDHSDTWLELDLLSFWSKYPKAKFSPGVIAGAVGCSKRSELKQALEKLVDSGVIESHEENGLSLYCLAANPAERAFFPQRGDSPSRHPRIRRGWLTRDYAARRILP